MGMWLIHFNESSRPVHACKPLPQLAGRSQGELAEPGGAMWLFALASPREHNLKWIFLNHPCYCVQTDLPPVPAAGRLMKFSLLHPFELFCCGKRGVNVWWCAWSETLAGGVTAENGGMESHNLLVWSTHSSWNSPSHAAAYRVGTKEIERLLHSFKGTEKHLLLTLNPKKEKPSACSSVLALFQCAARLLCVTCPIFKLFWV